MAPEFIQAGIDQQIFLSFLEVRNAHPWLDALAEGVANSFLFKGVFLIFLLLAVSTDKYGRYFHAREQYLLRAATGAIVALAVARGLLEVLPFRARPFLAYNPMTDSPFGAESSFPSDHAVLMTALAVAILARNRIVGAIALAWSVVFIFAPRIFLGLHYLSDVIVGAVIGAALMALVLRIRAPARIAAIARYAESRWPGPVYAVGFVCAYLIATNFDEARSIARFVFGGVERVLGIGGGS